MSSDARLYLKEVHAPLLNTGERPITAAQGRIIAGTDRGAYQAFAFPHRAEGLTRMDP